MVLATVRLFLQGRRRAFNQDSNPYFSPTSAISLQTFPIPVPSQATPETSRPTSTHSSPGVPAKKPRLDRPQPQKAPVERVGTRGYKKHENPVSDGVKKEPTTNDDPDTGLAKLNLSSVKTHVRISSETEQSTNIVPISNCKSNNTDLEDDQSSECSKSHSITTADSNGDDAYSSSSGINTEFVTKDDKQHCNRKGFDFRVGAKLEAMDDGNKWYPSRIVEVDWKVRDILLHYQGWSSRYDVWISMDSPRIRPVVRVSSKRKASDEISYKVGETLLAKWIDCRMYPAKVLSKNDNGSYKVLYYDGVKKTLLPIQLQKMPAIPAQVPMPAKKETEQVERCYTVGEIVLAKWTDCKMYQAKVVRVNDNGTYEVVYNDGVQKTVLPIHLQEIAPEYQHPESFNFGKHTPLQSTKITKVGSQIDISACNSQPNGTDDIKSDSDECKLQPNDKSPTSVNKQQSQSNGSALQKENGGMFQEKSEVVKLKPKTLNDSNLLETTDVTATLSQSQGQNDVSVTDEPLHSKQAPVFEFDVLDPNSFLKSPAPKEFIIEEDHNHFKCSVEECGKAFRKEMLLASHLKHYHNIKSSKRSNSFLVESSQNEENKIEQVTPTNEIQHPRINKSPVKVSPKVEEQQLEKSYKSPVRKVSQKIEDKSANHDKATATKTEAEIVTDKRQVIKKKAETVVSSPVKHQPTEAKSQTINSVKKKLEAAQAITLLSDNVVNDVKGQMSNCGVTKDGKSERKRKRTGSEGKSKKTSDLVALPHIEGTEKNISSPSKLNNTRTSSDALQSVPPKGDAVRRSRQISKTQSAASSSQITSDDESSTEDTSSEDDTANATMESWNKTSGDDTIGDAEREMSENTDIVNCICGSPEEGGLMMQCEVCLAWQHGSCFNIEQEEQVPERYVCFACKNPKGLRASYRFKYNQDWLQHGELPSFSFLQDTIVDPGLRVQVVQINALAGYCHHILRVMRSINCKLKLLETPDNPDLQLWAEPWNDAAFANNSDINIDPTESFGDTKSGKQTDISFFDHSYSFPQRGAGSQVREHSHQACDDYDVGHKKHKLTSKEIPQKKNGSVLRSNDADPIHCQLNLLDHVEHLQEELDRKLDEIEQMVIVLESDNDSSPVQTCDDTLNDLPEVKRSMKTLMNDLGKMTRIGLHR